MAKKKRAAEGEAKVDKPAAAPKQKKAPARKPAAEAAGGTPAGEPAKPAKKAAKGKSGGTSAARPAPQAPMIDTSLAAAAAAAMVGNRSPGQTAPAASGQGTTAAPMKESSSFRQLKERLSKPSTANLGGILGAPQGQKKSNLPFGGGKQVGRNQTFGADVNRSGVPRRTGG